MKTTKTVEITICDSCGKEFHGRNPHCIKCRKEICDGCTASVRLDVRRSSPTSRRSFNVSLEPSLGYRAAEYTVTYCDTCAIDIERNLLEFGFVARQSDADRYQAVMD